MLCYLVWFVVCVGCLLLLCDWWLFVGRCWMFSVWSLCLICVGFWVDGCRLSVECCLLLVVGILSLLVRRCSLLVARCLLSVCMLCVVVLVCCLILICSRLLI